MSESETSQYGCNHYDGRGIGLCGKCAAKLRERIDTQAEIINTWSPLLDQLDLLKRQLDEARRLLAGYGHNAPIP